jgi:putative transposase
LIKRRGYKFKFKNLDCQSQSKIRQFAGCRRFVYNKALELQKKRLDNNEKLLSYPKLCKLLVQWKQSKSISWLKKAPDRILQQTLKDLCKAFDNFFKKRAKFPKFQKKNRGDAFRFAAFKEFFIDETNNRIKLPKLGWLRYHNSRSIQGLAKNVTVSLTSDGYYFSVQTEVEIDQPRPEATSIVGLDIGIKRFITLSNGDFFEPLNSFRKHEKNLRRRQRLLSRKKRFSRNWYKAKRKVGQIHTKIGNVRRDYLHKISTTLSQNHAAVAVEDLQVRNMSASARGTRENPGRNVRAKSGLSKAILDQGWYMFRQFLQYKLEALGGQLVPVPAQYTSQTCPVCGHRAAENRLSQAEFCCQACGFEENADLVGALNVLAAGQAVLACGGLGAQGPPMKQEPAEETGEGLRSATSVGIL